MSELTDQEKRSALAVGLAEYKEWMAKAVTNGWKLPGNSPLPAHSWVHYWKACDAYARGLTKGRMDTIGTVAAARLLGISEISMRKLADTGVIPATRDDVGRRKFKRTDVEAHANLRAIRRARA